jgi:hypothetical protein
MTPLFDNQESCVHPQQDALVLRSHKAQRAYRRRERALEPVQGAHAVRPQVTAAVLGVAFACAVLIAAPISPVHALFTAKSATATNTIAFQDDLAGERGRVAPQSFSADTADGEGEGTASAAPGGEQADPSTPKPGDKPEGRSEAEASEGASAAGSKPGDESNGTVSDSVEGSEGAVQVADPATPASPAPPAPQEEQADPEAPAAGSAAPASSTTSASEKTQPAPQAAAGSGANITYAQGDSDE